jgi:subtilase family serine protease
VDSSSPSFNSSDLHLFDETFGLPDPPSFTKIGQTGGAAPAATDPTGGWEGEEALDVEWAHAIAPGASILLVEANSVSNADLYAAVDFARHQPGVSVVSMSLGGYEGKGDLSNDALLSTPPGHAGITFVAGSGDNGVPVYPATSPNVLAVGGTNLLTDAAGNYVGETAWSFSGGGISAYEHRPAYQGGVLTSGSNNRTSPDVAYNAGIGVAVYDSFNDGSQAPWTLGGGTSAGAPQWSALIAIADQGRSLQGLSTLDGPSQTLPMLYALPSSAFHDITVGHNAGYIAGPGYDLVTGRGSPVASQVVAGLMQPFSPSGSGSSSGVHSRSNPRGHFRHGHPAFHLSHSALTSEQKPTDRFSSDRR